MAPCSNASRLPYPNFTNFYINSDWHGYSHYNAMNVKFEHRARDLAVTAVYTWAKSKDDKSAAAGVGGTGRVSRASWTITIRSWTTALLLAAERLKREHGAGTGRFVKQLLKEADEAVRELS